MLKVRVLHDDGRDEVYNDVVKVCSARNTVLIYTKEQTFSIFADEILFMQTWVGE